jgi:hypothetical protein
MNDLQAAIAVMRKSPKSSLDVWVWGMTWTQEEHEAFQTVLVAAEKVPGLEMQVFDSESAVGCLQRDVAALEQRLAAAEINAARYEALKEKAEYCYNERVWSFDVNVQVVGDFEAFADALLAEGTAPPEGSATG